MLFSWCKSTPCSIFEKVPDGYYDFQQKKNNKKKKNPGIRPARYSLALARDVPESFANAVTKFAKDGPIHVHVAKAQKQKYLDTLREFVPTLCLPALEDHPDSVFVEDTVVAIRSKAVITNQGHPSRRGEVDSIQEVLRQFGYETVDMRQQDSSAFCDGGDVLFTGRHLFAGLSERTNQAGIDILSNSFGMETIAVPFDGEALHLKSIVTHIDESTLLAPMGGLGDEVLEKMKANELGYETIRLPNMLACNVVSVNGGILAQDAGCKESRKILEEVANERGHRIEFVSMSELAKADGALTCCSVLLEI